MLVPTAHLGGADTLPHVLDLVTTNAARAIGRGGRLLAHAGAGADLVVWTLPATPTRRSTCPPRRWIVNRGCPISSETSGLTGTWDRWLAYAEHP